MFACPGELEYEDGRAMRFVGTVLDVTQLTLAQQAVQEKEALLAEAQEMAHLGNFNTDLRSNKTVWSSELFRMFGYDPAQVEPSVDNFMRIVHPDDLARVQASYQRAMGSPTQSEYRLDHRIVGPAGVRHVEQRGRVNFDATGNPVRIFGTTMDVTEQREAEYAMQDYKEMLEQAEALVQLGSWAGEVNTQQLKISAQLFRNVGLDPSTHTPSDAEYLARIHPDDRDKVVDDMQRIRAGKEVGELLLRTDPAWGPIRWLRRTVRRIPGETDGRGPRYIGTLQDITESVQAKERLEQMNRELEQRVTSRTEELSQANQELEAFSYTVSHDLKAPLRGIDGYSQLLVEEYGDHLDDEGKNFVHRIRQGVQQMGDLISDLLDYSRMERRGMTPEPVEMLQMVQQILQGYEADVQRQGVQLRLDMAPFSLSLDREGIAVVLRNLIGNAIKFSRDSRPPVIEIGSRHEGGRRVLWVRDNGVGFDPAYHERMFKIFQRLHRSEDFPGTGVGLALVAKAAQRMGGRVWAESTLGAGATFYLEFPE
ncbi:MAG: PAS domain-containing protein [Burkholderiaceae bacterium]